VSLKTWKAELYPKPASRVSKRDALVHSLQKWKGLTKAALKKHGVELCSFGTLRDGAEEFYVASNSCALCMRYLRVSGGLMLGESGRCGECPLAISRNGIPCDRRTDAEGASPYHQFVLRGDARPMIRALQRAIRETAS
jgi:hypothetical protein